MFSVAHRLATYSTTDYTYIVMLLQARVHAHAYYLWARLDIVV